MQHPTHQTVRLARGRHDSPDDGACVMELASMLAGEPFSDHPRSVCPVVGAFLRLYNDRVDDDRRRDLYPVAAAVVGTRDGRDVERERARRCLEAAAAVQPVRARSLRLLTPRHAARHAASILAAHPEAHGAALAVAMDLAAIGQDAAAPLAGADVRLAIGGEGSPLTGNR